MTIYEKNIEMMKLHPYLYDEFNKFNKENNENNRLNSINLLDTRDESKSLAINYNDQEYRLNSSYHPIKEANRWAEQFDFKDMCARISMFGLGNGVFARELIKKLRTDDKMFIYEPCLDIFTYVLKRFDLSDIFERTDVFIIVEGINDDGFHTILRANIDWTNVHFQKFCVHPTYDLVFKESYKKYLIKLKDNNNATIINRNTLEYVGKFTVGNTINNMKHFRNSHLDMELYGEFPKDVPAIIVSAGPSLSKNVQYLKEAKGKAVIIVVDRALKFLLSSGIKPDFVITLDSGKPAEYFSDEKELSIPLFCTMDASGPIMERHKGIKIFYAIKGFSRHLLNKLNKEISGLNTGGCVATGAFSVCVGLGFNTIILIGQDLAYSNDKATHADGIANDDLKTVIAKVEGIDGELVETRHDWYSYLRWFQDSIKTFPDINVIDATEGGAKILGAKTMSLNEAISIYCKSSVNCNQILVGKSPVLLDKDLTEFCKILKKAIKDIDEIIEKSNETIKNCEILIEQAKKEMIHSSYSQKIVKAVSDVNKAIIEKPAYELIDSDIATTYVNNLADIYKLTGDEKQDQIITYEKAGRIYSDIEISAKRIKPLIIELLSFYEETV